MDISIAQIEIHPPSAQAVRKLLTPLHREGDLRPLESVDYGPLKPGAIQIGGLGATKL